MSETTRQARNAERKALLAKLKECGKHPYTEDPEMAIVREFYILFVNELTGPLDSDDCRRMLRAAKIAGRIWREHLDSLAPATRAMRGEG